MGEAMAEHRGDDDLWDEFHRVVNMTSRELQDWLRTEGAGQDVEELPDEAGPLTGRHVVDILGKRRTDLTSDDLAVMQRVVDRINRERRADLEPTAGDDAWRHRLMDLGHDPLKPS
jgi:hypothetical protein